MNKTFAVFANGGTMTTAQTALWQYDYGQILVVQGIELPTAYEVQFCNAGDSTTITSVGDSTGVVIPDQFLQNGETIYAYIYLHTGNADGETEYKITIPIMDRAEPTDIEPTPAQESTIGQLIDALNAGVEAAEEAAEKGPQIIDGYWYIWDAEADEYVNTNVEAVGEDGAPGNSIWWTVSLISDESMAGQVYGKIRSSWLKGRSGAPAVHDLVVGPAVGTSGSIVWLYEINSVAGIYCNLKGIGSIKGAPGDPGEDGYSPVVTITEIEGGHRITITDEAHPDGQSFDVLDGQGGSGSSDYDDLTNKPQIGGVELSGNKTAADLGLAPAGAYVKPSSGIPNSDLAEDAQRGYVVDDAAKGDVILAEATYSEWEEIDENPPYWNVSYSAGAPDPETTQFPDAVIITLDGVPYKVPRTPAEPSMANYGCLDDAQFPDFPQFFPVSISFWAGGFELFVQTAGEHTISANAAKTEVTTTPDFAAAVAKSSAEALARKLDTDGDAYRAVSLPMGHLDSTSTATVMTATVPGITELRDGVCVWLENGVIASASGVTLNINSLGAKPIYNSLSGAVVTTTFVAASTYLFVYNSTRVTGGCWDMVYGYDTNTTYTPPKLGFGYGVCSTAAATVAKTASISNYTLVPGGIVAIKFDNAVPAGATLNINSKGAKAIYYKGAAITAGVIKAGDTVTMIYSTYYHVLSIDRDADTQPPQPSDNTPYSIGASGSSGSSLAYARADHVHAIDGETVGVLLNEQITPYIDMIVLPSGAADGNAVMLRASVTGNVFVRYELMSALKHIAYFVIPLVQNPQDLNDFQVVSDASVSKVSATANGLGLQYNGIADGKLYSAEFVLPFDSNQATGTLSVTNLALPSAQGVSF